LVRAFEAAIEIGAKPSHSCELMDEMSAAGLPT
jgi:hypothetical protein